MIGHDVPFNGINKDRARDFYITAEIRFNQKNWRDCRLALNECLKYDPTHREAIELAASLFLKINQPHSAHKVLDGYSKILASPTKEYYLLRAKAHLLQNKLAECKEALDQCFAMKRDYEPALFVLADHSLKSGKSSDAIHIYERLHEKDKSNKDILYSLATAYFHQKEWDGAIIYCSKLLDSNVNHPEVDGIYRKSLEEKKKGLKQSRKRTLIQNLFAFLYDPETEKQLRIHSEQEWQLKRANQKGYLDEKTGILNFQALNDYFPALAGPSEEPIFVGFLDVNFFKYYNDFSGSHAVGDMVLKAVGKIGTEIFPGWFFRRSGDEFIFVYKGGERATLERAELFRSTVEDHALAYANDLILNAEPPLIDKSTQKPFVIDRKISVSIGIAQYKVDGRDLVTVLQASENNFNISHDGRKNAVVYQGKIVSSGEIPDKPLIGGR
jgi:GGDEF domain-containing protein